MTGSAPATGVFEDFFRLTGPKLVALGYVFTGDQSQAQDLAQETLLRAWQRWDAVSAYDDPAAWCRRVLCNLATSEWRRAARRRDLPPSATVSPEPDIEAIELARALDTLPPPQRTAIVLHDAGDLSVAAVAHELEVPEGTVRSWLSRGRKALAAELSPSDADDEMVQHDDRTR
ncbi:MAG TPA: SigE family RNA polymerase sigma factor [Acidimicrobiales bacterium]|nr:SigE family RNA polymerase sigma factor [Acidimicrobiales bacterium]